MNTARQQELKSEKPLPKSQRKTIPFTNKSIENWKPKNSREQRGFPRTNTTNGLKILARKNLKNKYWKLEYHLNKKKFLGLVILLFFWTSFGHTSVYYKEPLKRIYILGELKMSDASKVNKYLKKGAESIFMRSGGGLGDHRMSNLVRKKKLPIFIYHYCASGCTIISVNSPTLYVSEGAKFLFHNPQMGPGTHQQKKNTIMRMDSNYRKGGGTKEFFDKIKELRKKDTSKYDQRWKLIIGCSDLKKYFTKNEIFCDFFNSKDGTKFVIENKPNIKNIYCSNENIKQLVQVFFNPGCPVDYKEVKKNEYELLKGNFDTIHEFRGELAYIYNTNIKVLNKNFTY